MDGIKFLLTAFMSRAFFVGSDLGIATEDAE